MQELLMSIKTKHANKIFNGTKIYEFRTKSIKKDNLNKKVYIYSSEEERKIIGYIIFDEIIEGTPEEILSKTNYKSVGIKDYFKGRNICYALHISETYKFITPISIDEIKEKYKDFTIPQFYRYIKPEESIYKRLTQENIIHNMKLQHEYFDYILNGTKRIELRLNDEKRQRINIKDQIIFTNEQTQDKLFTNVTNIFRSNSFENLFNNFDIKLLADSKKTKNELLNELSKFYTEEKQNNYGVLGIEINPNYLISSNLNDEIINEIYELTKELEKHYFNYKEWFFNKHLKEQNRKTIYIKYNNKIIGVVNLKKEENKLCTIFIQKEYRNKGLSQLLLNESFKYLETTKPYVTCHENNIKYLEPLIKKYKWKKTGRIKDEIIYNKES